jgi:hypothetical protein
MQRPGHQEIALFCRLLSLQIVIATPVAQCRRRQLRCCCVTTITDEASTKATLAPSLAAPGAPQSPQAKSPAPLPMPSLSVPSLPEPSLPEPSLPEPSLPEPSLPGSSPVPLPPLAKQMRKAVKRRYEAELLRDKREWEDLFLSPLHSTPQTTGYVASATDSTTCTIADATDTTAIAAVITGNNLHRPRIIPRQRLHQQSSPHCQHHSCSCPHQLLSSAAVSTLTLKGARPPTPTPWPETFVFKWTQPTSSAKSVPK